MQIPSQQYAITEQNQLNGQETVNEQTLTAIALSQEKIIGARCFCLEDKYVVAMLAAPFYLKSERDECLNRIRSILCEASGATVYVTFDMDIFRNIRDDMSDLDKQRLLETVENRQLMPY